jgi:IS605 OrfB family transposase
MARAVEVDPTTRAYTLKLSGADGWRELLWTTHVTVNRSTWVWGDWLLTLRGGLPPDLADDLPERRALLALSWLSVESPEALAPKQHIVARGRDAIDDRRAAVMDRFRSILERLHVCDFDGWIADCEPALSARIRDDAVWVDRSACFADLADRYRGLDATWATNTLFNFLGDEIEYFALPDSDTAGSAESKDFSIEARSWLSRNWGGGTKSDPIAISEFLCTIANLDTGFMQGISGRDALSKILNGLDRESSTEDDTATLFKKIKQVVGWKGRPSKGALALEKIRDATIVTHDLWQKTVAKLREEIGDHKSKGQKGVPLTNWMGAWRSAMESNLGMPFHVGRDLTGEHSVVLAHALRRVSGAHSWIKRAEAERRRFRDDAAELRNVPAAAREWLDRFRESRSQTSGALEEYLIRKRAIDGWRKVIQAWADLGLSSTRQQRIDAARDVQANLDDNEKFGDIQLFAGFGDDEADTPHPSLADDDACCIWRGTDGKPVPEILKNYVDATTAESDQRRFKVPAYRHPDPLRHPVFVDFGNSQWSITYSALNAFQNRAKLLEKVGAAKTDQAKEKLRLQIETPPDLRGVALEIWNGGDMQTLSLRWHGKRFWTDLDLDHFGSREPAESVSRADRLGHIASGQSMNAPVSIAEVFEQKDWNGRLQVPRQQLNRLADLIYGKQAEPDYANLERLNSHNRVMKAWERLDWFLTTSAKLKPHGPWLDYVASGLPVGIEYKKGRTGFYLDYSVNKGRKSRARLHLSRLPGLRVLSFDLGHRYAAACAVWETITTTQMLDACRGANRADPISDELYVHIQRPTNQIQKSGRNKGNLVTSTTVYRRIGSDTLPDGSPNPAPWARLERQFLIKLQGEDRATRKATGHEIEGFNCFRRFLGLSAITGPLPIDELQRDAVRLARLGLRRFADIARIAYAMTADCKPISGDREVLLSHEQRVAYVQDALLIWQQFIAQTQYNDDWAKRLWQSVIVESLGGPQPMKMSQDARRSQRAKSVEASRSSLETIAEQLAESRSKAAIELNRLWADEYRNREQRWKEQLRWLRRLILPRKKEYKENSRGVRHVGGLSVKRIQTVRGLYHVMKAFRMRPEPDNLRRNIPTLGDQSLANFGRRVLNHLERLREQRIKQLASRIVEAALGAGALKKHKGRDPKRPQQCLNKPCHAVVAENLENYQPEDSRLRRENRQLMDWAARNVRKYIMEGCKLHGVIFVEVSPKYTSQQDSRTGAPGIRCEDVPTVVLAEAARLADGDTRSDSSNHSFESGSKMDWERRRWAREFGRIRNSASELTHRDRMLATILNRVNQIPGSRTSIRLPRRGGELFVSSSEVSNGVGCLQADLNAAANIGLRAIIDPDWIGAWWYLLVNLETGEPSKDKVTGCQVWDGSPPIWQPSKATLDTSYKQKGSTRSKPAKTDIYAWNPLFTGIFPMNSWLTTRPYWNEVERRIAERLTQIFLEPETPF